MGCKGENDKDNFNLHISQFIHILNSSMRLYRYFDFLRAVYAHAVNEKAIQENEVRQSLLEQIVQIALIELKNDKREWLINSVKTSESVDPVIY